MSITDDAGITGAKNTKALAVRLEPDLHQQLVLIAQLRDSTVTDEIRLAIKSHIAALKAAPSLAAKASSALEAIERDAATRRAALETLFGDSEPATAAGEPAQPAPTGNSTSGRGRGKTGTDASA